MPKTTLLIAFDSAFERAAPPSGRMAGKEGCDIEFQDIPLDDADVLPTGEHAVQRRDELRIELDGDHLPRPFCQQHGQAAQAGADLQHRICRFHLCRGDQAGKRCRIGQEILPQAFIRPQAMLAQQRGDIQGATV